MTPLSVLTLAFCPLRTHIDSEGPIDAVVRTAWQGVMMDLETIIALFSWGHVVNEPAVLFISIGEQVIVHPW